MYITIRAMFILVAAAQSRENYEQNYIEGYGLFPDPAIFSFSETEEDTKDTKEEIINISATKMVQDDSGNDSVKNEQSDKKILLWTPPNCKGCEPSESFKIGNLVFKKQNCAYQNCYVVPNNKPLALIQNASDYDAIIFFGTPIFWMKPQDLPQSRKPEQIYVFLQLESTAWYGPVCNKQFDDFFNWTVTYRLDSDIPWPYFVIKDMNNKTIGPKRSMVWKTKMLPVSKDVERIVKRKSKLAAWYVSKCQYDQSGRWKFVTKLNKEFLSQYHEQVDIYGRCGPFQCTQKKDINKKNKCYHALRKHYLFYMAMENSLAEDYVTEKVFRALDNYNIPVVFGGADYSRFLPPGSYIDAYKLGPERLTDVMTDLMINRTKAAEYFRWRNHYTYQDNNDDVLTAFPGLANCACDLCAKLNQRRETRRYENFRQWWNAGRKC